MPFVTKCCNSSQEWGGLQHFYATPSTPRRASIREQVLVKPSSSEWVIISHSSHFYAVYPKYLFVSETIRNFAVENNNQKESMRLELNK